MNSEKESERSESDKGRRSESTDDRRDHDYHRQTSRPQLSLPNGDIREIAVATPVRVLTTRYPLTTTGYKYLAIGITIKSPWYGIPSPSYVDIALGDKQGKEICLTRDMWRGLVERRRDILENLRSNLVDGTRSPSPISIGDLTLRFGMINNLPILRMELPNATRVAMSLNTVLTLYDLEFCVDRVVSALGAATEEVDAKYSRYREIAHDARKTGTSIKNAIRKSDHFDSGNIIDCEIAALCFKAYV
jgi:hypothetical protein